MAEPYQGKLLEIDGASAGNVGIGEPASSAAMPLHIEGDVEGVKELLPGIEQVIDDCGHVVGFIAKGYHPPIAMQAAIRHFGEGDFLIAGKRMEQTVKRCIPEPPGSDAVYKFRYEYSKSGRGAFPCTIVWLDF